MRRSCDGVETNYDSRCTDGLLIAVHVDLQGPVRSLQAASRSCWLATIPRAQNANFKCEGLASGIIDSEGVQRLQEAGK